MSSRPTVGTKIKIISLEDPYTRESYNGREGEVTFIDDLGNLFGTWGSLAVIPGVDDYVVIK